MSFVIFGKRRKMGAYAAGEMSDPALDGNTARCPQRGELVFEGRVVEQHGIAAKQGQLGGHGASAIAGAEHDVGVGGHAQAVPLVVADWMVRRWEPSKPRSGR